MKAAVLHRYDPELRNKEFLVYEEIDDPPAPGPGEVIVKIRLQGFAGPIFTSLLEGILVSLSQTYRMFWGMRMQEKFTVSGRESVSSKLEIKYCVIRFFLPG